MDKIKMIKNKKIKFGLFGLGSVVEGRVKNVFLKELKDSIITAVFDKDRKKNLKFSKLFNWKYSKNSRQFYKNDFDICYISTDSGSHYKNILQCFKNNKHVVVEKPPVLKVNQLKRLNQISLRKKLNFYVIYQNRKNKAVEFVKNFLKKNKKERIVLVDLKLLWCRKQSYYSRWHGKWKTDGGVLAQQGIHYIDLLCHFFGRPLKAVGLMENISNKLEAEDTHCGIIKFKKANCIFGLSTALRPNDSGASIEIYLQKKLIKLHGLCCNNLTLETYDGSKKKIYKNLSKKYSQKVMNGMGVSHFDFFRDIIKKFQKKTKIKPLRAIETIETLKLINMLYRSFEKNSWMKNMDKITSRLGNWKKN